MGILLQEGITLSSVSNPSKNKYRFKSGWARTPGSGKYKCECDNVTIYQKGKKITKKIIKQKTV